jgi:hypothetical protein
MKRGLGGVLVREEGMGGRIFFLTKGCKELSGGSHNWVIFGRCRVSAQLFFSVTWRRARRATPRRTPAAATEDLQEKEREAAPRSGRSPSRRRNSVAFFSI